MAPQNRPLKSEIHPAAKGCTADKIRANSGERDKSRSPLCWMETCSWSRMVVPLNEYCRGIFLFWKASPATFLTSTNYCFFACLLQKDAFTAAKKSEARSFYGWICENWLKILPDNGKIFLYLSCAVPFRGKGTVQNRKHAKIAASFPWAGFTAHTLAGGDV